MDKEGSPSDPGLGNMMLGYTLLGLQPIPVAMLSEAGVGAAETVFARFSLSLLLIVAICIARRRALATAQPKVLALRGLLGGCAVLLYFYSIQNAGAARGTLLNYTYPIWANLISTFFGARPSRSFWLGLLVALIGLWLLVVPQGGWGNRPIGRGELAGLGSALFAGAAVLTIKQLRKTDETLTIIASFSVVGLLMSIGFFDENARHHATQLRPVLLGLAVGVLAFLGHLFFTRGYRGMSVQHATLLSLSVPLVATVSGVLFLGEEISLRLLLGGGLILSATGLVLLRSSPQRTSGRATI